VLRFRKHKISQYILSRQPLAKWWWFTLGKIEIYEDQIWERWKINPIWVELQCMQSVVVYIEFKMSGEDMNALLLGLLHFLWLKCRMRCFEDFCKSFWGENFLFDFFLNFWFLRIKMNNKFKNFKNDKMNTPKRYST
jgi:hypothetical protein